VADFTPNWKKQAALNTFKKQMAIADIEELEA